jgi:hypothetical protein
MGCHRSNVNSLQIGILSFVVHSVKVPSARHHPPRRDVATDKLSMIFTLIRGRVHAVVRPGDQLKTTGLEY